MSVASLNNGQLQLSELVISNEKYSNAAGYVASSSVFSSATNNTYLNIDGTIASLTGLLQLGTAPVDVQLSCTSDNVLSIGGSATATGSFSAPFYGGGLYAVQFSTPTAVPANSSVNISIPNVPYNPIAGWSVGNIIPQFTLVSQYGELGLSGIGLVKDAGGLLDITLTVYNPNATNPQNLTYISGLLFYQ